MASSHPRDRWRLRRILYPSAIRALVLCALVLEASLMALHLADTQAEQVGLVLLSYVVGGIAFGLLLWRLRSSNDAQPSRGAVAFVIAAAVVFRVTLLPLSPATSGDVFRYLWEGRAQAKGFNPYTLSPGAEELAPLRQASPTLAEAVTFPDVAAIYPPFAQLLFLFNAFAFGGSLIGWKVILLCFEALLTAGLWSILKRRSMPLIGLAAVLWCPLLLLESYEAAHLDVIGAALIVVSIAAMDRQRPIVSGIILGLCINVKYLWPLLVLVLLAGRTARKRQSVVLVAAAVAAGAAVWVPYRLGFTAALATVRMFVETWSFNDLIFELVRLLPGPRWAPMVLVTMALVALAVWMTDWTSKLACQVGPTTHRRSEDVWPDVWLLMGAALLLGPVAYPWYFIWLVPGLVMRPPLWLVAWILSVPMLHVVDWHFAATGQWNAMPWLWAIVTLVPGVLLVRAWWRRLRYAPRRESEPTTTQVGGGSCGASFAGMAVDER